MTYTIRFDPDFVPLPIHRGLAPVSRQQFEVYRKEWVNRYGARYEVSV